MEKKRLHEVVVIGGGLSGLLVAHGLKSKGLEVALIESRSQLGGWVQSEMQHGCLVEWGPQSLFADERWLKHLLDLKLKIIEKPSSLKTRWIWAYGKLHPLPLNPIQLLTTSLLDFKDKTKLIRALFKSHSNLNSDQSLRQFFLPILGNSGVRNFLDPFISGVFAGDLDRLSTSAVFPALWDELKSGKSLVSFFKSRTPKKILSLEGGLRSWTKALSVSLQDQIYLDARVEEIKRSTDEFVIHLHGQEIRARFLVLATPSFVTSKLGRHLLDEESLKFLNGIFYQSMSVWNAVWPKAMKIPRGLGVLIPRAEGLNLLGSLWPSQMFPFRAENGLCITTQFFVGRRDVASANMTELRTILPNSEQPLWEETRYFENAIPQFELNHREKVSKLRLRLPPGLYLNGNYLDGVGLSSVYDTSTKLVDAIVMDRSKFQR